MLLLEMGLHLPELLLELNLRTRRLLSPGEHQTPPERLRELQAIPQRHKVEDKVQRAHLDLHMVQDLIVTVQRGTVCVRRGHMNVDEAAVCFGRLAF